MNGDFDDIVAVIDRRLALLEPEAVELIERLKPLEKEIARLHAARSELVPGPRPPLKKQRERKETIKQIAIAALTAGARPMSANEILAVINKRTATPMKRECLAPQLSRLAKDGRLRHIGDLWSLPQPRSQNV